MFKQVKKEVHRRNNVARWAVMLSLIVLTILTLVVIIIDLSFLHDFIKAKDKLFRLFLVILSVIICLSLIRYFVSNFSRRLNEAYLEQFQHIPEHLYFKETLWRKNFPKKETSKYKHAVLMLHGFAASTQEFQHLFPIFEREGIIYLAPNITGFGRDHLKLLANVKFQDWIRNALYHYDMLSELAEEISIIGHSMGSLLATHIAKHRPVKNLILSGPAMFVGERDKRIKKFITSKHLSNLYIWLFPFFPKPINKDRKSVADMMDEAHLNDIFQYIACPTYAVKQLALLQNYVDILEAKCQKLHLIYGKYEKTINVRQLLFVLKGNQIKFTEKCYLNSAHNCFGDLDKEETAQDTVRMLLA